MPGIESKEKGARNIVIICGTEVERWKVERGGPIRRKRGAPTGKCKRDGKGAIKKIRGLRATFPMWENRRYL